MVNSSYHTLINQITAVFLTEKDFLLKNGVESELLESISDIKMLNLKCTSKFEIVEFPSFNYCIAQSLVSHLNQSDLDLFLKKIKQKAAPGSLFFFSFPESKTMITSTQVILASLLTISTFITLESILR